MTADFCSRHGFTDKRRLSLLQSAGLDADDHGRLRQLRAQVIEPALGQVVDEFYDKLSVMAEAQDVLHRRATLGPLKKTMRNYLLTLGQDFDTPAYIESRLRIGLAHVRAGVPLTAYIFAARLLEQLILQHAPALSEADRGLGELLGRILTLDLAVAAETYHRVRMQALETSIEEMQMEESYLLTMAHSDSLTGLPNHDRGLELIDEAWHRCKGRQPLCIIMADLDNFKRVNDEHGHQTGDKVLKDGAARIRAAVRRKDKVSRYGGEEFLIILENTPVSTATEVAQRILEHMSATPFQVGSRRLAVTISLGIALVRDSDSIEDMVARADAALYRAKRQGRNQWVVDEQDAAGD